MSDLSTERSRQDNNGTKLIYYKSANNYKTVHYLPKAETQT